MRARLAGISIYPRKGYAYKIVATPPAFVAFVREHTFRTGFRQQIAPESNESIDRTRVWLDANCKN
jgi:hypothetical protein